MIQKYQLTLESNQLSLHNKNKKDIGMLEIRIKWVEPKLGSILKFDQIRFFPTSLK